MAARQRLIYGLPTLRFSLMFASLPGALVGNDPDNGYGNVTVEVDRVEDAIAHLRKHGYLVRKHDRVDGVRVECSLRPHLSDNVTLRIRKSRGRQKTAICFGCKGPIIGHQAWVRVDSRTFAHAGCVEGAR